MPGRTGAPVRRRAWLALALVSALLGAGGAPVPATATGSGSWALTFSDEFDGRRVDPRKWANGFGWGQGARNTYGWCDPANNTVSGGVLRQTIERRPQRGKGWSVGCLNTRGRFAQRYGFWEARVRTAGCHGARGAFWAKPDDESWPPELDVVEVHGDEPNVARLTQYWHDGQQVRRSQGRFTGPDFDAGFHVFAAQWSPTETIWYVDGRERRRTTDGAGAMGAAGAFYMMINAQVYLPDSRCGDDPYDRHQLVDYVRIWDRSPGPPPPETPQPLAPEAACDGAGPLSAAGDLPDGLSEASGLAASRRRPGWGWFIRDSGNPASLYAFRDNGAGGVDRVRQVPVAGAMNRDWEDIVYHPGPDGGGRLWVIESGQGGSHRFLYEIPEPDPERAGTVRAQRYRYAYPDAPANTEAGFILGGRLALVTKTAPARVYVFQNGLTRGVVNHPVFVGELSGADQVSVVRFSPDGRLLIAASHRTLHVYRRPRPTGQRLALPSGRPSEVYRIGRTSAVEAGDWFPAGGCRLLMFSENRQVHEALFGGRATGSDGPAR